MASPEIRFEVTETWSSGFNGKLFIRNMADVTMDRWTVSFSDPGLTIKTVWGASLVSSAGGTLSFEAKDWTLDLQPDEEGSFGFTADGVPPASLANLTFTPFYAGGVDPTEPTPVISIGDAVRNEEDGSVTVTASLSAPSTRDVSATWETQTGTAGSNDFVMTSGTLTIPAGSTSAALSVMLLDDARVEADETFSVVLTGATYADLGDATATVTIRDTDTPGTQGAILDGTDDQPEVRFEVTQTWNGGFNGKIFIKNTTGETIDRWTVSFDNPDLTVTTVWGAELVSSNAQKLVFEARDWTLDLQAGEEGNFGFTARGVPPSSLNDLVFLTNVTADTPAPGDAGQPELRFEVTDTWTGGFNGKIFITNTTGKTIDTWSATFDNPDLTITTVWGAELILATPETFYFEGRDWTLDLQPGEEANFGFTARGTPPSNLTGLSFVPDYAGDEGTGSDGTPPTVSVSDRSVNEEAGTVSVTVVLSKISTDDVTVNWTTNLGTAGPTDFVQDSGSLTIKAGMLTGTISVALTDDNNAELDETFTVLLTEASGATLGDAKATVTILNSDTAPGGGDASPENIPELSFGVTQTWSTGFNAQVAIENDTDRLVETWTVRFDNPGLTIKAVWGADLISTANGEFVFQSKDWTLDVDPGETASFGFTADGTPPASLSGLTIEPVFEPDPGLADPTGRTVPSDGPYASDNGSPFDGGDYQDVLGKSMLFYYAQYSGDLPDDHPVAWRNDSALTDGADVGRDLTGGWYDAGDHVKFGLPSAYTATMLAWGGIAFEDGYKTSGSYGDLVNHLEWITDYFLRAYDDKGTADLSDDVFYAQVGDGALDHAFWGAPEDMTMDRPTFAITADNPGTEVTAETAAAMAASSILLRDAGQTAYADELLAAAQKLYAFAETYQGNYAEAIPEVEDFYNSWSGYSDELAWGANWLYQATGDTSYLEKSEAYYNSPSYSWTINWDNKYHGLSQLLAIQTGDYVYTRDVWLHLNTWMDDITKTPGTATNEGMGWLGQWGSARYAANVAFLSTHWAKALAADDSVANAAAIRELQNFATDQIDYMLGDNPDSQSYVVGFGDDFPLQPHHRAASGTTNVQDPGPNAYELTGALVGGPDEFGTYNDSRSDYVQNEVALDYNAGFTGALAALAEIHDDFGG